ncbi:hypothetical protein [Thalassotalea sp. ND16A]|uniref:hypothetical protein n=1 Tax=Thalassotalea sp. ND16A TaxID=1535422 RepID=UPI00051A584F|nr:hypothetical protein [Thalassotalea sp. ND16A]KGJ89328.1 hypothetical protein ND16A_2221 [Thalassotalea sp. ND16A]
MKQILLILSLFLVWTCSSDIAPPGHQRAEILQIRDNTLVEILALDPELVGDINAAPAFAIFSNQSNDKVKLANGIGIGVIHNNLTGHNHFLLAETTLTQQPNTRFIFVFDNKPQIEKFISYAQVIHDESEMAEHPTFSLSDIALTVYQLNQGGELLSVNLKEGRFWQSERLNQTE